MKHMQPLEARRLLAVSIVQTGTTLTITGTDTADTVSVFDGDMVVITSGSTTADYIFDPASPVDHIIIDVMGGDDVVRLYGDHVYDARVFLGDGDDLVEMNADIGDDAISGGAGIDAISYAGRTGGMDFSLSRHPDDPPFPAGPDDRFYFTAERRSRDFDTIEDVEELQGTPSNDRLLVVDTILYNSNTAFTFDGNAGQDTFRYEDVRFGELGPSVQFHANRFSFSGYDLYYSSVERFETRNGAFDTDIRDLPLPLHIEAAGEVVAAYNSSVVFTRPDEIDALRLFDDSFATLRSNMRVVSVLVEDGSQFDIAAHSLFFGRNSNFDRFRIRTLLRQGYAEGAWDGNGIISSLADATRGIGMFEVNLLTEPATELRLSVNGDTNRDGRVDVSDLGTLSTNFRGTDLYWTDGDFNYDGVVDVADLGILSANFRLANATAAAVSPCSRTRITSILTPADHAAILESSSFMSY